MLVFGSGANKSELAKAEKLGIRMLDEDGFFDLDFDYKVCKSISPVV